MTAGTFEKDMPVGSVVRVVGDLYFIVRARPSAGDQLDLNEDVLKLRELVTVEMNRLRTKWHPQVFVTGDVRAEELN